MPPATPVVFDLDGVLVDSEPLYEEAFQRYVASLGRPELGELFAITLGRRDADWVPELAPVVRRTTDEITAGLRGSLLQVLDGGIAPMPKVSEAVALLDDGARAVGLASSSRRSFVERALSELGVTRHFAAVATGDEVRRGKPDPEIYRLAAARLEVSPEACAAIEDTPVGIESARSAGMRVIAVPNRHTCELDLTAADVVADDLLVAAQAIRGWDGQ